MAKKNLFIFISSLLVLFIFRLFMGFSKFSSHDEIQTYLIGLKSFTNNCFPFFGPDVVYTKSRIPGGLQGLLISFPLKFFNSPEAPYYLLNLLSFGTLTFLSWYISKRVPNIPKILIYIWILTCTWAIHYSTHIENPSYVLIGSVLFFISVFELSNIYSKKLLSKNLCFFLLGFSLFWIMQLHLSWPLMLFYIIWIIWMNRNNRKLLVKGFVFFLLGSLLSSSTLIPTIIHGYTTGGAESNITFNPKNLLEIPSIISRFLSFGSFEMVRFIGNSNSERIDFLIKYFWALPFNLIVLIAGIFQVIYLIYSFFYNSQLKEWQKVKHFTLGTILLVSISFLFSITKPKSHTFYVLFPVAIWYSFYCYQRIYTKKFNFLIYAALFSGIIFHATLFIDRLPNRSLFAHKHLVKNAIKSKDYTLLAVRRESLLMNKYKENFWSKIKNERKTIYTTGFEVKNAFFKPQNLVSTYTFEGNYACKLDSIQRFGCQFINNLKSLNFPDEINVQFQARSNGINHFRIVIEINEKDSMVYWNNSGFAPINNRNTEWIQYNLSLKLPKKYTLNEAQVKLYFWMPEKSEKRIYIDNVIIEPNHIKL